MLQSCAEQNTVSLIAQWKWRLTSRAKDKYWKKKFTEYIRCINKRNREMRVHTVTYNARVNANSWKDVPASFNCKLYHCKDKIKVLDHVKLLHNFLMLYFAR